MKKYDFPYSAIPLSILLLLITSYSCTSKSKGHGKPISYEAAKIAPQFKSAKYQDEQGNVLPYRYFEPAAKNDLTIFKRYVF